MALVSIILPTYNGEQFLAQAIESCLNQTYRNLELIVVNDCSTDGTAAIIDNYARTDSRVRVITNEINRKLPGSLNIGFENAKGNYLTWTSDDNYFATHALEKLVSELANDPGTDIVYSSYQFIDEKGKLLEIFGNAPENLIFKCVIGACFLYRRNVHELLEGFAEDKFRMEDMDFWLRAATRFRFKFIDEKDLYSYRKHTKSLTYGIYSNEEVYKKYRSDYKHSFRQFFENGFNTQLTESELQLHAELFFEDLIQLKDRNFDLSEKVMAYLSYLDKLNQLDWKMVGFRPEKVREIINWKKERIVGLVINDLVFENRLLAKANPKLATHLNKPISWYYREYEVLPTWYKRFGHIIKIFQRNRPAKSY